MTLGINLSSYKPYVEPAVNRQPGFRRELVGQNHLSHPIHSDSFIEMYPISNFEMKKIFLIFS